MKATIIVTILVILELLNCEALSYMILTPLVLMWLGKVATAIIEKGEI